MAQYSAGEGLPDAATGSEREVFLRGFLQKIFPSHRRFSTGCITDSDGNLSGQIDIAVEFGLGPSFSMPITEERLLLAESVALVISVKSDLSKQWGGVRDEIRKIRKLHRKMDWNTPFEIGRLTGPQIPCVAVGYTGYKTPDRLLRRIKTTPEDERPIAALVIESGCFCWPDPFGAKPDEPEFLAKGAYGLYALCFLVNVLADRLRYSHPNMLVYVLPPAEDDRRTEP